MKLNKRTYHMYSRSLFMQEYRNRFFLDNDVPVTSFGGQRHPLTSFVGRFRMAVSKSLKRWNPAQGNRENPRKI